MNAEEYYKDNDFDLELKDEDIRYIATVIIKLENGKDKVFCLDLKDRGMTTEDIDVFLKYLVLIDFIKRNMQWQKQYLCLMGPITYAKYRKAVFDRLTTPMSIERFLDIGVEE